METINETEKNTETTSEAKKTAAPKNNNKLTVAIVALIAVVVVSTAVIVDTMQRNQNVDEPPPVSTGGLSIGYAQDSKVFTDQNALQAAMDEAIRNAEDHRVALRYQNDAFSDDGINFKCYIGNSTGNLYDMFLTICTDPAMTDQVFLSQLVRPGSGFESVTLDRALESGDHTVYVAVTLVDTAADGSQTIKSQVVHTMDFHVLK